MVGKAQGNKTLICGHRGAAAVAPENTLAAVATARGLGVPMVEVDLRLTRDREVVVHHDARLGRTVRGRGRVADTDLADLQTLDAGSVFAPSFSGERVPTLAELLTAAGPDLRLNLELKTDPGDGPSRGRRLAEKTLQQLAGASLGDRILLTSFDHDLMRWVAGRPGAPACGFICGDRFPDPGVQAPGVTVFSVRYTLIEGDAVRAAHAAGLAVHAWTVNDPDVATALGNMGVDVLISDDPGALLNPR